MASFLDVLIGKPAADYTQQQNQYQGYQEQARKSLFDMMTQQMQEKRLKQAMGSMPQPAQEPQFDGTGPLAFMDAQPGTGIFTGKSPEEASNIQAQAMMGLIDPQAFSATFTNTMNAPLEYTKYMAGKAAEGQNQIALAQWNREHPEGPKEGSNFDYAANDAQGVPRRYTDVYMGGEWVTKGGGDYFSEGGSGSAINRTFKDEQEMYKTFEGLAPVKNYKLIQKQQGRVSQARKALEDYRAGRGSTKSLIAVDQSLITIFNKAMDENSVVRESEYARTPADQALVSRLKGGLAKQIEDGGAGLKDEERYALINMIDNFAGVSKELYETEADYTRARAKRYGFNPNAVVRPEEFQAGMDLTRPIAPQIVDELPPGFAMQPDGTALNPETGQVARRE